jgi:hypothetical protein
MATKEEYRRALRELPASHWQAFLDQHSNLPGPRANLTLVQVAADEGTIDWFLVLAESPDEYHATVGAVGLGRILAQRDDADIETRLRELARDSRWRVREGVAMGLQRLGDADPPRLWSLCQEWMTDEHPLVERAAAAAICEPRLLREAAAVEVALSVCETATNALTRRPSEERRADGARSLRQALGYCWSVAVAADPARGLSRFESMANDADADVMWIVRENRKKARMKRATTGRGLWSMPPRHADGHGDAADGFRS